jgi:hypothetical protein
VFDKACEMGRRASSRSAPAADIRAEQPAVAEVEGPSICAEMTRTDSYSLGEFPLDVVRIECERCGRAGRYRLAGLIERFGPRRGPARRPHGSGHMRPPAGLLEALWRTVHGLGGADLSLPADGARRVGERKGDTRAGGPQPENESRAPASNAVNVGQELPYALAWPASSLTNSRPSAAWTTPPFAGPCLLRANTLAGAVHVWDRMASERERRRPRSQRVEDSGRSCACA